MYPFPLKQISYHKAHRNYARPATRQSRSSTSPMPNVPTVIPGVRQAKTLQRIFVIHLCTQQYRFVVPLFPQRDAASRHASFPLRESERASVAVAKRFSPTTTSHIRGRAILLLERCELAASSCAQLAGGGFAASCKSVFVLRE